MPEVSLARIDLQKHLDNLSRSFAFCIAQLPAGFKEAVGISYLLFRFLDTIEDSAWSHSEAQAQAYATFRKNVLNPFTPQPWSEIFKAASLNQHEKELLQDIDLLFIEFSSLNISVQKIISNGLLSMESGMRHFSNKNFRPKNLKEVNQYCFFVAGIVGELLEELFQQHSQLKDRQQHLVPAVHFGLFLQKVNILKDQVVDEAEGRFWVHDRNEILRSLRLHGEQAFAYLQSLPLVHRGYRLFCAWSLFIGLANLPLYEQGFKQKKSKKMGRFRTLILIDRIKRKIDFPQELEIEFEGYFSKAFKSESHIDYHESFEDNGIIMKLYQGQLSVPQLTQLNVL